jgi:DNA-binding response OmpR family regulator
MAERKRILIIDDESDHCELVALLLERRGYEVETARDSKSGLTCAWRSRPDLVLLDFFMPTVDGLTTAQQLRENAITRAVPIVLMTACGEEAMRNHKAQLALFSWLAKPFRASELLWVVEDALAHDDEQAAVAP